MNFTLTPGVYAALNLLSKATRSKVLEAAFAFVLCGIRPVNLSKNLLVMFMMVVDSASEGRLTYVPDAPAEAKVEEQESHEAEEQPDVQPNESEPLKDYDEATHAEENHYFHLTGGNRILSDDEIKSASGIKIKKVLSHRRKRNRNAAR